VRAAENGKQVAVVVELKARFDEAANLRIAERMEEAGIHVTYGVVGLKTHCKVILVVRRDYNGIRRYVHIGTGNYHTDTARLYSDLGLFTSDDAIGQDVTELFNYLTTGFSPKRIYRKLLPAPKLLKKALLENIEREIAVHRESGGGVIQFKMNALDDSDIVKKLYLACQAGVKVDLFIRDSCRFRSGVPGLSETARVISIVGRFLEHSRLYYFRNGGQEEFYIGSADAMKRNLESRVEVIVPVESKELRDELRSLLDAHDADHRYAWEMQPDGSFTQRIPQHGEEGAGLQQFLIQQAMKSARMAQRMKRRVVRLIN
jgi:polyphosphate kinase